MIFFSPLMEKVSFSVSSGPLVPYWGNWCTGDPFIMWRCSAIKRSLTKGGSSGTGLKEREQSWQAQRHLLNHRHLGTTQNSGGSSSPRGKTTVLAKARATKSPQQGLKADPDWDTFYLILVNIAVSQLSQICIGYVGLEEFRLKLPSTGTSSWPRSSISRVRGAVLRFTCKWELAIELLHIWEEFGQFGKAGTCQLHICFSAVFFGTLAPDINRYFSSLESSLFISWLAVYPPKSLLQKYGSPAPDFQITLVWCGLESHWTALGCMSAHLCSGAW